MLKRRWTYVFPSQTLILSPATVARDPPTMASRLICIFQATQGGGLKVSRAPRIFLQPRKVKREALFLSQTHVNPRFFPAEGANGTPGGPQGL